MKRFYFIVLIAIAIFVDCFGQEKQEVVSKYGIEIFPQVALFRIYSVQMVYKISENNHLIVGFTYLNSFYPNKKNAIGRFYAPTLPIGFRKYIWKNLNIEVQLWPAYDMYKDLTQDKFYNGFDLVASIRCGWRFDFRIKKLPLYTNVQLEYLLGIYKGNKPDNFDDVDTGISVFPAISIGYKL